MNILKVIGISLFAVLLNSCRMGKTITLELEDFEINYIYKNQSILSAQRSIKRRVKITDKTKHKRIKFDMMPDIEHLDEPRFFHVDSIKFDGKVYQHLIWIEDPFAFAIIDLQHLKILYNSHGEDRVEERIEVNSEKNCLGKIRYRKLYLNDCTIGFR